MASTNLSCVAFWTDLTSQKNIKKSRPSKNIPKSQKSTPRAPKASILEDVLCKFGLPFFTKFRDPPKYLKLQHAWSENLTFTIFGPLNLTSNIYLFLTHNIYENQVFSRRHPPGPDCSSFDVILHQKILFVNPL